MTPIIALSRNVEQESMNREAAFRKREAEDLLFGTSEWKK
jgi:hypothetical protein